MEENKKLCQCCGMPLEEALFSREPDGRVNEDFCKWCYHDGVYTYTDMKVLIDFCVEHFATEQFPAEQMRALMEKTLPELKYWKNR